MKVAIIGCGAIAPVHIYALYNHQIVALCDVDVAKAQKLKEDFQLDCQIYDDYKQMLAQCQLDSVHICTPHYLHAQMSIYALQRNVHVLCEKPMCVNEKQLQELEKAVKNSQAQYGVCFQSRYNTTTLLAQEFLRQNKPLCGEGLVFWQRDDNYYLSSGWRGQLDKEGGSVLINQSIHTLDLLCYLVGNPTTVCAVTSNLRHQNSINTEDVVVANYELPKANFQLFGTTNSIVDKPAVVKIVTQKGTLSVDYTNFAIDGKVTHVEQSKPMGKGVWGTSHKPLIDDFYNAIATKRKFAVDFDNAQFTHKVVFATYASQGKSITIK